MITRRVNDARVPNCGFQASAFSPTAWWQARSHCPAPRGSTTCVGGGMRHGSEKWREEIKASITHKRLEARKMKREIMHGR